MRHPHLLLSCVIHLGMLLCAGCASDSYQDSEVSSIPTTAKVMPSESLTRSVLRWSSQFNNHAARFCDRDQIFANKLWEGGVWYYDGARVFYNAADFFRSEQWEQCAEFIIELYRQYVIDADGKIPGWRVFPHGLYQHYLRTGDRTSRFAILLLAEESAFAQKSGGLSSDLSRETAYLIHTYLIALELGIQTFQSRLDTAIYYANQHLQQWIDFRSSNYVKPFMMGLTFEALIAAYQRTPDPTILNNIENAAQWLWRTSWDPQKMAFPYIVCADGSDYSECIETPIASAPDLNLLIAPAYAWLYVTTGDSQYAEMSDQIFVGGVAGADLNSGKRFSQNYRWSKDYIEWRFGIDTNSGLK